MNAFEDFGRLSRAARIMRESAMPWDMTRWAQERDAVQAAFERYGPQITFGGMLLFLLGHACAATEHLEQNFTTPTLARDAYDAFERERARLVRPN